MPTYASPKQPGKSNSVALTFFNLAPRVGGMISERDVCATLYNKQSRQRRMDQVPYSSPSVHPGCLLSSPFIINDPRHTQK